MTVGKAIIDTNVPIVANGDNDRVAPICRIRTIEFLAEMMGSGTLVIDQEGLVEKEYFDNLRLGYPGVGNRFIQHFFAVHADRIDRIPLYQSAMSVTHRALVKPVRRLSNSSA